MHNMIKHQVEQSKIEQLYILVARQVFPLKTFWEALYLNVLLICYNDGTLFRHQGHQENSRV